MPCPTAAPIPGAIVVFVVPKHLSPERAPQVTKTIPTKALGGVPLLRLALPPAAPLEIGSIVYARMVGPLEGGDPMKRTRASREIGIEGRIVATRPGEEWDEVEFVVRNVSWGLAVYASILVRATMPFAVTVSKAQQESLYAYPVGQPRDRSSAHKPVEENANFVPGSGSRDSDYLYFVPGGSVPATLPFRDASSRSKGADGARAVVEISSALGFGWSDRLVSGV
ncbi:hypothetical protein VTO73DRAFT_4510 [Trametes versicolor]